MVEEMDGVQVNGEPSMTRRRAAPRYPLFGDWLRTESEARGLTRTALAALLGVSQPTVSEYLGGKKVPHRTRWPRLAKAFGVDVSSIASLIDPTLADEAPGAGQVVAPLRVPVLRVASANPADNRSNVIDHVSAIPTRRLAPGERWFAIVVPDDALAPHPCAGWVAVYDPRGPQEPGADVVVTRDGVSRVRRLAFAGGAWVVTGGPEGDQPAEAALIVGVVVQYIVKPSRA